jgi:sugar lactone lactonase YvrE
MVVTSNVNNSLVFFNRFNNSYNYTFSYLQSVNYVGPHGLWRVNDSFFYATSYTNNAVYSYSTTGVNAAWNERWVLTAPTVNSTIGTTHLKIDECNRLWLCVETDTVLIYDQQGNLLGNYTIPNSIIADVKMTENYLMYFSDKSNRIIRVDPNIIC